MLLTSDNPTFESKGDFQGIILNRTNQVIFVGSSHLTYPKLPPHQWTKGKDWSCHENKNAHPFNSPAGEGKYGRIGACPFLTVKDRSAGHVEEGYTYIFYTESESIRFCFKLTGVAGGSVVLPGFGLWNILEKPDAWTYIWPTDFQGEWGFQVLSCTYATPYSLSALYKPLQGSDFTMPSAIIYTWEAPTFSDLSSIGQEKPGEPGEPGEPGKPPKGFVQQILSDPKTYKMTSDLLEEID